MTYLQKPASKYRAKSTEYNGQVYHSKFEAAYAEELDWREKAGDIRGWKRQVAIELEVNGSPIARYYIDFVVAHNDGSREFVECKGFETEVWRLKWKLLEATFADHKEHPDDRLTVVKQSSWGRPRFG